MTNRIPAALVSSFAAALALAGAGSGAPRAAAHPITVATAAGVDYRVVLTASRDSSDAPPAAHVTVTTYERASGGWQVGRAERLAGTYFWHTITGPHALCRLELRTSARPHVVVQLLQSPALGCGPANVVPLGARP